MVKFSQVFRVVEDIWPNAQDRAMRPPEAELCCHAKYFVEFGSPADQILEFAKNRRADLIILGVPGRSVSRELPRT